MTQLLPGKFLEALNKRITELKKTQKDRFESEYPLSREDTDYLGAYINGLCEARRICQNILKEELDTRSKN